MRRNLHAATVIDAPREIAWERLCGFSAYPQWNPVFVRAEGRAEFGATLALDIRAPGLAPRTLRARLLRVHPPRELLWIARSGFPGVLDIEYRASLEPLADGRTELRQEVQIGGLLTLFVWRRIEAAAQAALERVGQVFASEYTDTGNDLSTPSDKSA